MKLRINFAALSVLIFVLVVATFASTQAVPLSAATPAATTAAAAAQASTTLNVSCTQLPNFAALKSALTKARQTKNGGLDVDMWGVIVDRDGAVCAVAFTGANRGAQFPGSRLVAAAKANTANALSQPKVALSTANLYSATQPGGTLFGATDLLPLDPAVAYAGSATQYGQADDPLVGKKPGGLVVFGGGLALYDKNAQPIGAVGVSGDSSCADHNIVWKTRSYLKLDYVPFGVSATKDDNIIYDISGGKSASGWGHPECGPDSTSIGQALPKDFPISH
jgi:uncharacterized protein GlcG (DUF336 family)